MNLDGNINPFTEEPITEVKAYEWEEYSLETLYEQLYTLRNRQRSAANLRNMPMYHAIEEGINNLEVIIASKQSIKVEHDRQKYSD